MSQPDSPLWVRTLAVLLALVASWWLIHTEAIHGLLGNSVAALSLGMVAVFVLRGTHQPLRLWPARPARPEFSVLWSTVPLALGAGLIIVSGASGAVSQAVRSVLVTNRGTVLVVIVGAIAWGLGVGLVRQQRYGRWYAVALASAITPLVFGWIFRGVPAPPSSEALPTLGLLGWCFWSATETSRVLVTEELTFRRMLMGHSERAGVAVVLGAAGVSAIWLLLIGQGVTLTAMQVVHALLVASVAGSLYSLSGSLLVAALYHGVYVAALMSFVSQPVDNLGLAPRAPLAAVIATGVMAAVLLGLVVRERGLLGQMVHVGAQDAAGN